MKLADLSSEVITTKIEGISYLRFLYYVVATRFFSFMRRVFPSLESWLRKIELKRNMPRFVIENENGRYSVQPFDDSMTISSAYFERELKDWLAVPASKDIFIDIGSNLGRYSILATKFFGYSKAYAFEANPDTAEISRINVELNKLEGTMEVENYGLGAIAATSLFLKDKLHKGGSMFVEPDFVAETGDEVIKIDVVPFDELRKTLGIHVDEISFVKIDVEGYEKHVLAGMAETLSQVQPGTAIMIELSKDQPESIAYLEKYGFREEEKSNNDHLFVKA